MHGYSTDSSERRVVPLFLALLSIALAWVSSRFLAAAHLSVPWWLDAPSSIAFYGVLYGLFERFLWRNSLVPKLGLVRIPNLMGRWRGYLITSFDGPCKSPRFGDPYLPELDANQRVPDDGEFDVPELRGSDSGR